MKVIVAGLYKTGTKSMKDALEVLDYDVWDVAEQLNHVGGVEQWEALMTYNGDATPMLKEMLSNCEAVTDGPAAVLAVEIYKAFPTCKVILCVRDNEDVWFESYKRNRDTLNNNFLLRLMRYISPTVSRRFEIMRLANDVISSGRFVNPLSSIMTYDISPLLCKRAYNAHIAYVTQQVPQSNLLTFNVKQGWEPLCNFLGKEEPQVEFPHTNRNAGNATTSGVYRHAMFSSVKSVRNRVAMEVTMAVCVAFAVVVPMFFVYLLK
nr:uncharacterized protein LOC100181739 [Ciona intestinalis]|eukprot:XP_002126498.1 uncharacterized protein LOC100181739 [Ciona intestinalis]